MLVPYATGEGELLHLFLSSCKTLDVFLNLMYFHIAVLMPYSIFIIFYPDYDQELIILHKTFFVMQVISYKGGTFILMMNLGYK